MRKSRNYLQQIYRVKPESDTFVIEVSLQDFKELFDGWDPSPVKRRDIEPDLLHFLEVCAQDIPLKYPLELEFYLPEDQKDTEKEEVSTTGIRNNFTFIILFTRMQLKAISRKILIYIAMSFAFLSVAYLSKQNFASNLLTTTLMEGFSIGGWVFLWEAFSLFLFSMQEINNKLKQYVRFSKTPINFTYK